MQLFKHNSFPIAGKPVFALVFVILLKTLIMYSNKYLLSILKHATLYKAHNKVPIARNFHKTKSKNEENF